ncbi:MAG TPA: RluA family pseudouridine synthase [Methylomirabilota bacterium]|nr:RluA family pseudouridine synthase [Methylomirabilota bacterium]
MPKPPFVELSDGSTLVRLPILYEDRSLLAVDKPAGWMLIPFSWQKTPWNLQAALTSSIASGAFWARARGIRFLRAIHRLDAETTGILLCGKSPGSVESYSELFESRRIEKIYLAVVEGVPKPREWVVRDPIGPVPGQPGRMRVDPRHGKPAETRFRLLQASGGRALIEARPVTGRTHQIRVHLARAGLPIAGDAVYGRSGKPGSSANYPMALRAVAVRFRDPFTRQPIRIEAPSDEFLRAWGWIRETAVGDRRDSRDGAVGR